MAALDWQRCTDEPDALGESPFWHPHEHMLYWVDVAGQRLRRAVPGAPGPTCKTGEAQSWSMPSEPGCIAPARSGGLVVALRDGIYRARTWGGPLERMAAALHDPAITRFNDGRADPLGRFWASTRHERRDQPQAALYCLMQGQLHPMAGDAFTGNGLAFSPDQRTLYWADTAAHRIDAWDWDAQANRLGARRVFKQFSAKPAGWTPGAAGYGGRPDGAAIDAEGNYWCALYEGGRLLQLAPDGRLLQDIPVPARCPTMPCFGGEDLRTLYLTTARDGRSPPELQAWPMSGHVLCARVDVPGRLVDFVEC